jgi:hypothetical protein
MLVKKQAKSDIKQKLTIWVEIHQALLQHHCYDVVHENVGNPALKTRPTILNPFLCIFTVLEMF